MIKMLEFISIPLQFLLSACYNLLHNYVLAIIVFTALTKVILFPISLWTHRNGIKMVELTPDLNWLKIKYYGDLDTIAEETQKLYKQKNYHPLLSTVPMLIQLVLLMGVIGAVRVLLAGTGNILTVLPSEQKGVTLLMPVAAGLAALALGLAQNRINPLQREQPPIGQWTTNGISIAISLVLGAFVPVGVGIYWIASNLLTIVQQLALNAVIPPQKYVDYEALSKSKRELSSIENLSADISKEDKRREKADYKRFFSVANKHLVFYSESSGFYKYFQAVIEYLLVHSNIIIHYITSDPKDQIFELAKSQPHIRPYYIGEKRLITLMMKMDADIVVMTMPDLGSYHIKRSYVRSDVEYVYMYHGLFTGLETVRKGAFDHFDTLLLPAPDMGAEIRGYNEKYGLPDQRMIPCGYSVIDSMALEYERMGKQENPVKLVLVAPSWQKDNILESCLQDLAEPLLAAGYDVTVRPHPQYIRRFPQQLQAIMAACKSYNKDRFRLQLDFSSNVSVYSSDILVTDWSNIGYEYALATKKPVLFINTPKKRVNAEWTDADISRYGVDSEIRSAIGVAMELPDIRTQVEEVADRMISDRVKWDEAIEKVRRERLYHFGESGKYGAKYLIERLLDNQKKKKEG